MHSYSNTLNTGCPITCVILPSFPVFPAVMLHFSSCAKRLLRWRVQHPVMLNQMSVRPSVRACRFFVSFAMRHLTWRHHFWVLDKGDKNPVWHFGFFKKGPISWISRWCEHSPGPVFGPLFWWFLWKIKNKTRRCFWRFKSKYRKIDLTRTCKLQTFCKKVNL